MLVRGAAAFVSSWRRMTYLVHRPEPPLDAHVDYLWLYEGAAPDGSLERVLPQGSFELVFNLKEEPRRLYRDESAVCWEEFRHAWLSGAHARYLVIDVLQTASMIGAHFRPGGAAALLPCPASEFTDRVVELSSVWGAAAAELRERMLCAARPFEKFRLLEEFLRARFRMPADPGTQWAVNELCSNPAAARIADLAAALGISHKQLIHRFRQHTGLAPKKLCRIRRFQAALKEIEARKKLDWAGVAAETGFYDQSHFIHEFIEFSGLNPSAYLTIKGEHINHVPIQPR